MCSIDRPGWSEGWNRSEPEPGDGSAGSGRPGGVTGVEFVPPAAAKELLDAVQAVGALDPSTLTEDERFGLLDALEHAERVLTAAGMTTLIATEDRGGFDVRFGMTPGAYSEQRHGRDRLSWTRRIRVGRKLAAHLPEVHRALCEGRISVERAMVLANAINVRNASLLGEAQASLLDLSEHTPRFSDFLAQVRDLAAVADVDGPEPEPERSKGKVSRTGDHVAIVMDLYGTDAIAAEQMLEAEVDLLWKAEHDEAERIPDLVPRSRAELRAAAFVELLRRGVAARSGGSRRPSVELSLVVDADRVDDLHPTLAAVVAATAGGDEHHVEGDHVEMPGRFAGVTVAVAAPDGSRRILSQQQWQLLLCDSSISQVLLDALGEPLAVRSLDRFADPAMRRALTARDGGCVFPGCDAAPSWCDAHHVVEHQVGGETVIVNLALLCRRHHGVVHRSGWRMIRSPDGSADGGFFTITTPTGCAMATQHRPRPGPTGTRPSAPPGRPPGPA
ncbi:HNH endonuclease signature motif containing protein [Dermatobacter hominis]|uniref:HNH endonuclease signature motif containing protein n=1 Tax=Dermatobacter hominis TaxID=2884263 RepID=UPI001D12C7ED|nr:HNH endonuclease signature motif containing protein [Dermatobacter hominis]UDY36022.1 HNH endonuclease [Dermatobacter hominis]